MKDSQHILCTDLEKQDVPLYKSKTVTGQQDTLDPSRAC